MEEMKNKVVVVYAPFQVPWIFGTDYEGFFEMLRRNYEKIIIFLPVRRLPPTPSAPFDFETRANLLADFADLILPLPNEKYPNIRVIKLDAAIRSALGTLQSARFVGVKPALYLDHSYAAEYQTHGGKYSWNSYPFYSEDLDIRLQSFNRPLQERTYEDGLFLALAAQWPIQFPVVDLVVFRNVGGRTELLLGRKPGERNLRFAGGFKDRTDSCFEDTVYREGGEELLKKGIDPKSVFSAPVYIASMNVNDWRSEPGDTWTPVTLLFALEFIGDDPSVIQAGDDLEATQWVYLTDLRSGKIVLEGEHKKLLEKYLEKAESVL